MCCVLYKQILLVIPSKRARILAGFSARCQSSNTAVVSRSPYFLANREIFVCHWRGRKESLCEYVYANSLSHGSAAKQKKHRRMFGDTRCMPWWSILDINWALIKCVDIGLVGERGAERKRDRSPSRQSLLFWLNIAKIVTSPDCRGLRPTLTPWPNLRIAFPSCQRGL